jgi:hypothetical protein
MMKILFLKIWDVTQELASGTLTYEAWACMGLPHMVLATRPSTCHAHAHAIN